MKSFKDYYFGYESADGNRTEKKVSYKYNSYSELRKVAEDFKYGKRS